MGKHIKFFYAPDAFTKEYLFTDEWEYPTPTGCKWTTDLKRGGVSIWNWVGDYSWVNNANKFDSRPWTRSFRLPPVLSMDGTTSTLESTTTTDRGPGLSPTTRRTGTSSLERSLLKTSLCWMVRDSATSSWTPGPPLTPWSGSASPSGAWSPSPGTLLARMS